MAAILDPPINYRLVCVNLSLRGCRWELELQEVVARSSESCHVNRRLTKVGIIAAAVCVHTPVQ
jgi:hypothetical protein